jgi:hypothetical protein
MPYYYPSKTSVLYLNSLVKAVAVFNNSPLNTCIVKAFIKNRPVEAIEGA